MKTIKIFNYIVLFFSLIGCIYLFLNNIDYFKINVKKIQYEFFFLIILSTVNSFISNYLNYFVSKSYHKLTLNNFTTINLISNLSNDLIPFFGTFYKGYVLKKFNLSYFNYFGVLLFLRIVQFYFTFIIILFLILIFEKNIFVYLVATSIFIFQYFFFIYLKTLNLKNKFIKKFKPYFFLLKKKKKEIFTYLFGIRFTDFLIFYILIQSINTIDFKSILIFYFLRILILHLPFINGAFVKILFTTFTLSFLELSLYESFFINFFHSILTIFGLLIYLLINYYYEIKK